MKKIIFFVLGIICFVIGCIGLALPIVPQIPFFVLAMIFLAESSTWIKKKVSKTKLYQKSVSLFQAHRNKK